MNELLDLAVMAAKQAGIAILSIYRQPIDVEIKKDGSPLTLADQNAHQAIIAVLGVSELPVVSEECDDLHMDAQRYWLVDPLDGTKDFLAGNDEFTVNIALIEEQRPVLGVVYAPALDEIYVGAQRLGAWVEIAGVRSSCIAAVRSVRCRMAVSRFHDHPDVEVFAAANRINERIAMGSALKYGRLASAAVDVFPRLVGSSEWDTAAGQAVLEAAGGQVLDWHTGELLRYGKAKRRNPRLLALRAGYLFADFKLKHYEQVLL
jgi:3'(2'), 5'-bisphosphate nucleotidase